MKKILSAILAVAMLSAMSVNVLSEAYGTGITRAVMPIPDVQTNADGMFDEQNRLKEVLTQVKLLIDIPEEYTEFDYSLYTRYQKENWNFIWRTENNTKNINIDADGDGRITYYNKYIRPTLLKAPAVRKAQALETAYGFIEKLYPEIMNELELITENTSIYFGSNCYQFNFRRVVNDIPYDANSLSISVDHTDGEVRSFSINWTAGLEFDSPENVISASDALAKWKSDSEMELKYRIFSRYENGEYVNTIAKPVYLNKDAQKNILALTGEYLEENYGWTANDKFMAPEESENVTMDSMASGSLNSSSRVEFSENELKRMQELAGYIKVEDADKIVRSYTDLAIDDSFTLSSYSTGYSYQPYTDTADRPVVWNLSYTGVVREGDFSPLTARATVNAVTGELVSFSSYRYYDHFDKDGNFVKPVLKIEKEKAEKLADNFLEKVQPEKYDDLAVASVSTTNSFTYKAKDYGNDDGYNDGVYYTSLAASYNRTHNEIQVMGNSASVTVDCVEGKITNYSVSWTDNLTFESEKAEIDAETALDIYLENSDVKLEYIHYTVYLYDEAAVKAADTNMVSGKYYGGDVIETRDETRLVYAFSCPFYAVSAVSGKPIDHNGEEYVHQIYEKFDGFNDIDGHWAQEKIELLSDIGVVIASESFRPDEAITQKEFIAMLMAVTNHHPIIYRYSDIDANLSALVEEMKYSNYYIPEKDDDIVPEAPLMRKDAAKFIMRGMGYEKIATLGNIFKTDFADNDAIDTDYIGYAALAQALGIISGSHGCFNGDENITRAESVILICNYMNAEK